MLLPGRSLPPSAHIKSRKQDTGEQIQHRCITCEGLLTSGYICIAFSLRNLNQRQPFLPSPLPLRCKCHSTCTVTPNSDFSMIISGLALCFSFVIGCLLLILSAICIFTCSKLGERKKSRGRLGDCKKPS